MALKYAACLETVQRDTHIVIAVTPQSCDSGHQDDAVRLPLTDVQQEDMASAVMQFHRKS